MRFVKENATPVVQSAQLLKYCNVTGPARLRAVMAGRRGKRDSVVDDKDEDEGHRLQRPSVSDGSAPMA